MNSCFTPFLAVDLHQLLSLHRKRISFLWWSTFRSKNKLRKTQLKFPYLQLTRVIWGLLVILILEISPVIEAETKTKQLWPGCFPVTVVSVQFCWDHSHSLVEKCVMYGSDPIRWILLLINPAAITRLSCSVAAPDIWSRQREQELT